MVLKTERRYYVLMEYVHGATVQERVQKEPEGRMPEQLAAKWGWQLADAMEYLHGRHIVHRDLKCDNLMAAQPRDDLKLLDFGLSRRMVDGRDARVQGSGLSLFDMLELNTELQKLFGTNYSDTHCGTLSYASPELLQPGSYDPFKSDCWAVGVCIYFMAFGRLPFESKQPRNLIHAIIGTPLVNLMPPRDFPVSKPCRDLLLAILVPVDSRPPLTYIKQHLWLRSHWRSDWTPPELAAVPSPTQTLKSASPVRENRSNQDANAIVRENNSASKAAAPSSPGAGPSSKQLRTPAAKPPAAAQCESEEVEMDYVVLFDEDTEMLVYENPKQEDNPKQQETTSGHKAPNEQPANEKKL